MLFQQVLDILVPTFCVATRVPTLRAIQGGMRALTSNRLSSDNSVRVM